MKKQILVAALVCAGLLTWSAAQASDITCMNNHEDLAAQRVKKAIFKNIAAMLAKKGIGLDSAKSSFDISAAQVNFQYDGVYGYFSISESKLVTNNGTELTAEYKQQSFNVEDAINAYFRPSMKSGGFDKEGNAIHGHCTLISDNVRVTDRAEFIYIENANTGRIIGRVELPSKIQLY